jgi:hypothetical protein
MNKTTRALLYEEGQSPTSGVAFQFNPTSISVSHTATMRDVGLKVASKNPAGEGVADSRASNLTNSQVLEKIGTTQLRLSDLVFDGHDVVPHCGKLLGWSYSYASQIGASRAKRVQLPVLVFSWGEFALSARGSSAIKVIVTRTDITYQRFSARGRPIRARVALELQPIADNPLRQNPTSGGLPDRRVHVVTDGQNLPGIAVEHYKSPAKWRELAIINDIDDPLRMKPGQRVYLPEQVDLERPR